MSDTSMPLSSYTSPAAGLPVRTRQEMEGEGAHLSDILRRIVEINAVVGWSHYNYATMRYFVDKSVTCLCARPRTGDSIVGYIIVKFPSPGENANVEVPFLATATKAHGVGRSLLQAAVKTVRERGLPALHLDCRPGVLGFYTKFAEKEHLRIVQVRSGFYRNGDVRMHIMYDLSSPSPSDAGK